MAKHPVKCTACGFDFSAEPSETTCVCPNCNSEISTVKAIKYYLSLSRIQTEQKKIAEGETYLQVDRLLDEADFYVKNGEFDVALEKALEAESLSTTSSRLYMLKVVCKTKNFEDLNDVSHLEDFKKAIDNASFQEKEALKRIYAPYYRKRHLTSEEKSDYEMQEAQSIYARVEDNLKAEIPSHFKREKFLKTWLWLTIIFAVITVALVVVSIAIDNPILSAVACVIFIAFIIFIATYSTNKLKIKVFNQGLDFFDVFESLNLTGQEKIKTLSSLEEFSVSALNGESPSRQESILAKTLFYAYNGNSQSAISVIENDERFIKTLSKYYE